MNKKISQLPQLTSLTGNELIPVAFNDTSSAVPISLIGSVIDKTALGLNHVNNTSDLNKPLSTATIAALLQKADISHTHVISNIMGLQAALDLKANVAHQHTSTDMIDFTSAVTTVATNVINSLNLNVSMMQADW